MNSCLINISTVIHSVINNYITISTVDFHYRPSQLSTAPNRHHNDYILSSSSPLIGKYNITDSDAKYMPPGDK